MTEGMIGIGDLLLAEAGFTSFGKLITADGVEVGTTYVQPASNALGSN